jgi:hypothetical protein
VWKKLAIIVGVALGVMALSILGMGIAPTSYGVVFGVLFIGAPVIAFFVAGHSSTVDLSMGRDLMKFGLGLLAVLAAVGLLWMTQR